MHCVIAATRGQPIVLVPQQPKTTSTAPPTRITVSQIRQVVVEQGGITTSRHQQASSSSHTVAAAPLRGSRKRGQRDSDSDEEGEAGVGESLAGSKKRARRGDCHSDDDDDEAMTE